MDCSNYDKYYIEQTKFKKTRFKGQCIYSRPDKSAITNHCLSTGQKFPNLTC